MHIHCLTVGIMSENTYILENEGQALIIDPGAEGKRIQTKISDLGLNPLAILLTHTHFDHIGELDNLRQLYHIEAYVHPNEQAWLSDPEKNLSSIMLGKGFSRKEAEHEFVDNAYYTFGPFNLQVVETPGHSPGGVSFIFTDDKVVLTGDSLFKASVGRTDFYGGNIHDLLNGIKKQLFTLPDDYQVYPGHGEATTIGEEKVTNPFLNN